MTKNYNIRNVRWLTRALLVSAAFVCISYFASAQNKNQIMTNDHAYSVEIIRYTIPQDMRANFENAYAQAAAYLQASSYCLGYEVIHGEDEPDHYIVRIHWTSVDDHLQGFRKSKEFAGFFNLVKPFFNNIEEMKHYRVTSMVWDR